MSRERRSAYGKSLYCWIFIFIRINVKKGRKLTKPLLLLDAVALGHAYQSREITPVDVLEQVLSEANVCAELRPFSQIAAEHALRSAEEAKLRWSAGKPLSPLDGVPISIKDNLGMRGTATRFGSLAIDDDAADLEDSPCVAKLRAAGAVLFAKTTMPDFAHKIVTDSPLTGTTCNPWNPLHTPGGSSGGSAVAVARGLGPISIGTDGGGSIRIPAAFCGIFGFKPSFGRVPHYPRGAFALLSHVGPMTRTVRDAAAVLNVISTPDKADWYSLPYDPVDYETNIGAMPARMRVACSADLGLGLPVMDSISAATRHSAQFLEELGAFVEEAVPPSILDCNRIHRVMWAALCARLASGLGKDKASKFDGSLKALVLAGENATRDEVLEALVLRGEAGKSVNEFFERFDVLLCPVHPTVAPALANIDRESPPFPCFTQWCNQLGLPAASVYCGLTPDGLPLAVQVVGPRFADLRVLQVAQFLESAWGKPAFAPPVAMPH